MWCQQMQSVTDGLTGGQTNTRTDDRQGNLYVVLCWHHKNITLFKMSLNAGIHFCNNYLHEDLGAKVTNSAAVSKPESLLEAFFVLDSGSVLTCDLSLN